MPGSERTAGSVSIARLMATEGLSEDELFAPRSEELPRIRNGTVTLIPVEDKQRVLDLLQEVLRFRIELGCLISLLRGDAYLRTRKALGEDFCYVSTQPTERLSNVPVAFVLQKLATFLGIRHGLDVRPGDLHFEISGGEQIPNGYTLLDLIFVAATSSRRRDHFSDSYKVFKVTLEYTPRVLPLGPIGQGFL